MGHKTGFNHRNPVELVARYIGTSYDTVKMVAANMQSVIVVADNIDLIAELNSNIDVIEIVSDNIDDVIAVSENIDTMNEILANIDTITFVSDNMDTLLFIENEILNNDLLGRIDTLEVDVIDLQNEVIRLDNKIDSIPTFSPIDKAKLDGIEDGATADQTGAEIKALYEAEADTNAFTDAEKTKLSNLTDLTDAEIKTKYENNPDTNAFTDSDVNQLAQNTSDIADLQGTIVGTDLSVSYTANDVLLESSTGDDVTIVGADSLNAGLLTSTDKVKLDGVESGAQVNVGEEFTSAEKTKLQGIEDGAEANVGEEYTLTEKNKLAGVEDGAEANIGEEFTLVEKTKLSGIEDGATGDMTDLEIKTAYENNSDTNAFTDAEKTKLAGLAPQSGDIDSLQTLTGMPESSVDLGTFTGTILSDNLTVKNALQEVEDILEAGFSGSTNLSTSYTTDTVTVESDTGSDAIINSATTILAGNMSASDKVKLDGIEIGATADQTGTEIKSLYEAQPNTNAFDDAAVSKLASIEDNATGDMTDAEIKAAYEANADTNAYTDLEKSKLAGVEDNATADQTGSEIKALYEAEPDTNAFTDNDKILVDGAIQSLTAGANVIVGSLTNDNDLYISVTPSTTIGLTNRVYITGDTETTTEGTFYTTSNIDGGTVPEVQLTATVDDGETDFLPSDFLSIIYPDNAVLPAGTYEGNLSVSSSNGSAELSITQEIYLTDPQGVIMDSGLTYNEIGSLGVRPLLYLYSGIFELSVNDITNVPVGGVLREAVPALANNRARYRTLITKENTAGGAVDVTVYIGSDHNSYLNSISPVGTDDIVNDSDITGATLTDALNLLELSDADIKTKYENNPDTNAFTDAEKSKLSGLGGTNLGTQYFDSKITIISSTGYDTDIAAANATDIGLMTAADKNKLDGIQDLTAPEIKVLYESNADTNAFTNAEKDKLASISSDELDRPGTVRITTEDLSSKNYYDITNDTVLHKDIEPTIYNDTVVITTVHSELTGSMLGNSYVPYALAEGVYAELRFSDKKMYIFTDFENRTDEALFDTSAYVADIDHNDWLGSVNGDRFFIRDAAANKITMLTFDKNAGNATAIISSISAFVFDTTGLVSNYQYFTTEGVYLGSDWSNIAYQSFANWTNPSAVTFENWSSYLNAGQSYNYRMITPLGFYFSQGFVVNPATGEAKEISDYTCNSNFACWHEDGYDYFSLLDTIARVDSNFNLEILPLNGFDTGRDRFVGVYLDADNYYWQTNYQIIREYVLNGVDQDLGVNMYMMSLGTSSQPKKRSQVMFRYDNKLLSLDSTSGMMKKTGYVRIIPDTVTITGQQANGSELTYWMKGEFKDV